MTSASPSSPSAATVVGCVLATLLLTSALAQSPARHVMTPDDLGKLLRVDSPTVSPDGAWVAYTVAHVDADDDKSITNLWMVSWDGKQDLQLTSGKESAGNPRWSPDGHYLAFTSSREGEGKGAQVWLLDRRGGEARQLTKVAEDLQDYRWSPDSKQLLLTLQTKEEPEPEKGAKPKPPKPIVLDRFHFKQDVDGYLTEKQPHLFLFDIASQKITKLTSAPLTGPAAFAEGAAEWSPDGKQIAFVSNQNAPDPDRFNNPDIFVAAATPGTTAHKLTTFTGSDDGPLAWTADSARILYRQGSSPHYSIYDMPHLASVAASGGTPPVLVAPSLDQWTGAPVLAPDGKSLLTTIADDRQQLVAELPLTGKATPQRLTQEPGSALSLDAAGGHVALLWTTDTAPSEIFALEGKSLRRLTTHNDALLQTLTLAPAIDLSAKSPDGNEVHSLLTLPPGFKPGGSKLPLLLRIHGGPTSQDAHEFEADRQLLAAHGYAVLNVNYRGSTGRGHLYSETINADWGNKEVKDLLAAVDGAIHSQPIDPGRLGVGGWSYGGILTDYTIATTTRFKVASSGAGMANLLGLYGIDEYILQYENELGPPWKNPDAYIKLSYPFLHADRIKTPTLFMGGDKDFNVPLEGGEQMFEALRSVGTPAELIVYPGEFHGFTRPSFIKDRYVRWLDWYDKYLGKPTLTP